ncbi:MAG: hypothetical protein CVU90_14685 [Firmicutes bacterium HGW-Firmicutes-15]|nr:MAG: hypothetical protein CVU90_14685 [Firmicutes bacterium HGW-Firmicutes-15]
MFDIRSLAKFGTAKRFSTDEIFFNEGDPGHELFILLTGRVAVLLNSIDGSQFKVAELGPGAFFGEMSLLELMPRSATILALEESIVIAVDQNNFVELISNQPELIFRIMKGMSSRMRQLNEELAGLKPGDEDEIPNEGDGETSTAASALGSVAQAAIIPEAAKKQYSLTASKGDETYTFDKDTLCPVCEKPFNVKMVRSSKLRLKGHEPDLRQLFVDFEPLWYMAYVCPNCYYANFNYEFKQVNAEIKGMVIKESEKLKKEFKISFSNPRKLNEVLNSFYLVLHILYLARKPDLSKIAKVWLRLSWLYADADDQEMHRMATEKALEAFKETYFNSSRNTSPDQEQRLALLLGELSMRIDLLEESAKFFRNAILRKGGNAQINRQAEDRIQELKALILAQESAAE